MRKDMIGMLGPLCFLEHHCFHSALEARLGWKERRASCRSEILHPPSSLAFPFVDVIHIPLLRPSLTELPHITGLPEFCACGTSQCYKGTERQRVKDSHRACIFLVHMHTPLSHWTSLTKHKFKKNKTIRDFKKFNFKIRNIKNFNLVTAFKPSFMLPRARFCVCIEVAHP